MRGRDLVILVLDQMQIFDQQIALPRPVAEQALNLVRRSRIDLAAFWRRLGALAALAGMFELTDLVDVVSH